MKDVTPSGSRIETRCKLLKVDESLGLVFGFAAISTIDGEPFFDSQGDYIPDDVLLKASVDFAENSRVAKEMHAGEQKGTVVFTFPLTAEVAKSLGIETKMTGLLIGMRPTPEVFEKFQDGTYSGFSLGGSYGTVEEVPE